MQSATRPTWRSLQPERRRVVLDEDIGWKLATQLFSRGRDNATSVYQEKLRESKDGALFKTLAAHYEPFVLVTWDNKMPVAHAADLNHHGTTLAIVDERWFKRKGLPDGEKKHYIHDVVHRWLHRIEVMPSGERLFFSPQGTRRPNQ
jgi:hypothetical protein